MLANGTESAQPLRKHAKTAEDKRDRGREVHTGCSGTERGAEGVLHHILLGGATRASHQLRRAESGGPRYRMSEGSSTADQARANLSPPYFDCDLGVEAPKDRGLRGHVTPARNALAERAQDGQRVGVVSAVGAPDYG